MAQWKRYEVVLVNPSWSGNPFDLELSAVFTHVSTGRTYSQLGFYAGNDTWKIYFMPSEVGVWSFETISADPELDGHEGFFECVDSNLPGQLEGNGNRWQLSDSGEYVAPIILPTRQWFKATETENGVDKFIEWADETAGALIIGTTLVYFQHEQAAIPYLQGEEGEWFNIPMWDRINSHLDFMRDRGMGFYVMFYSDASESPNQWGIGEKSPEELRLFRYAVARFAAYPMVIWDTGIDIGETRSEEWIDWFADWFNANDPWQHLVGSRSGGGSGGNHPANGTFYSDGASTLPSHGEVVDNWASCLLPLAYTDRWREDYPRGNFDRDKIRRAAWEIGLVGGTAVYVSGNENGGYLTKDYATDFKAAPDLGHRSRFFREQIDSFASLVPHSELITAGDGAALVADPGREYILYDRNGGAVGIDLSGVDTSLDVSWYDPITGQLTEDGTISGGSIQVFTPPRAGDFVLRLQSSDLLQRFAGDDVPPDQGYENSLFRGFFPLIVGGNGVTIECDRAISNESPSISGLGDWLRADLGRLRTAQRGGILRLAVPLVVVMMISLSYLFIHRAKREL